MNRRLDTSHLRRCLLMFRALELRNGTRDGAHEQALLRITGELIPRTLEAWAEQFPETPFLNRAGRYTFVGGSDDHAGLSIARAYTTFRGEPSGAGVCAALSAGATAVGGDPATPEVLSHNVYGVMGGYIARSGQLASGPELDQPGTSPSLAQTLTRFSEVLVANGGDLDLGALSRAGHTDAAQGKLYQALETVLVHSGRDALGQPDAGAGPVAAGGLRRSPARPVQGGVLRACPTWRAGAPSPTIAGRPTRSPIAWAAAGRPRARPGWRCCPTPSTR